MNSLLRNVLLLLLLISNGLLLGADNNNATVSKLYEEDLMSSISVSAPTASSLGQYGEYSVDLANGLVPISFNLHEIKCGSLTVPITLSYHGGGVKVDQDPSWVGLGWDLSFGGSILRTMNGVIDEKEDCNSFPDYNRLQEDINNNDLSSYSTIYNLSIGRLGISYKPDLFSYSVPGHGGTFFIGKNGDVYPISYAPIKGSVSSNSTKGSYLVTPDGTQYKFNESEFTEVVGKFGRIEKYPSAYYVSSIISANKADTIRYKYGNSVLYSKDINSYCKGESVTTGSVGITQFAENSTIQHRTGTVKPECIYFRGGRVSFEVSNDLFVNESTNTKCPKLNKITVEVENNGKYIQVKKILFYYTRDSYGRLFLQSVKEVGLHNDTKDIASFEYTKGLPSKNSNSIDFWGFYNGRSNVDKLPKTQLSSGNYYGSANRFPNEKYMKCGSLEKITYPTGGSTEFVWEINQVDNKKPIYYDSQRVTESKTVAPSTIHSNVPTTESVKITSKITQTVSLSYTMKRLETGVNTHKTDAMYISYGGKKVTLGTNSSISKTVSVTLNANTPYTIVMSANCRNLQGGFTISYDNVTSIQDDKTFAGLRIKEMIQRDKDGSVIKRQCYEYLNPQGQSSGYLTAAPDMSFVDEKVIESQTDVSTLNSPLVEKTNTMVCSNMVTGPKENEYSYEFVNEYTVDGKNGKTISCNKYQFTKAYDQYISRNTPVISKSHLRGLLIKKDEYTYDSDGGQFLVRTTRNTYTKDSSINFEKKGIAIYTKYSGIGTKDLVRRMPKDQVLSTIYNLYGYSYSSDWMHQDSTIIIEYFPDGSCSKSIAVNHYGNKNHIQPTRIETKNDFEAVIEEIKYPADFQNDDACKLMQSRNMVCYPIVVKLYHSIDPTKCIGGVRNVYNEKCLKSEVLKILPNGKEVRLYQYKYNDIKNHYTLSEYIGQDSIPTSILWDDMNLRPLVVVSGMSGLSLKTSVASVSLDESTLQKLYMNDEFKNAMVQTYTYHPDGSVKSITQPNGVTTYYEYDGLGRLSTILDQKEKTIQNVIYHYSE